MSQESRPGPVTDAEAPRGLAGQIVAAFEQPIPKARLSVFYQLGLLITTLVVITLPLIYIAIIVALGYGVYQYAIHGAEWVGLTDGMGRGSGRVKLFAYIAPLGMGVVLIGFMVKPFLAPRVDRIIGPTLTREDQPVLFNFVERLCEKLGAPVPRRIEVMADVNASAGFRRGWLSFFGRDLVLMIGMPLAAGLTVRQLGGIIAHEFGHFRQGTAMRLDYMTRSVNGWFARVVYTRDGWDQALLDGVNSQVGYAVVFCLLMQLAVWVTRRVLWVLMLIAHGVSCFMSRQMEYDADKAFAAIAGSDAVGPTLARVGLLSVLMGEALQTRGPGMSSQELYDNLPGYVVKGVKLVGRDRVQAFSAQMMGEPTRWFDTHPALGKRIEHAKALDAPGVLAIDADAALLFRDFDRLSKAVTYAFYRHHLGDRLERYRLVETGQAIGELDERGERVGRLERYLGVYVSHRPPRTVMEAPKAPADARKALQDLKAARDVMVRQRDAVKQAHDRASEAEQAFVRTAVFHAWLSFAPAPMRAKAPEELKTPEAAKAKHAQAGETLKTQRQALADLQRPLNQRLALALQLLMAPELDRVAPNLGRQRARAAELVATLRNLAGHQPRMTRLDLQRGVVMGWMQAQATLPHDVEAHRHGQRLIREAREAVDQLARDTTLLLDAKGHTQANEEGDTYSIDEQQLASANHGAGADAVDFAPLDKLFALYDKSLGELVGIAEAVETQLRLGPLFAEPAQAGS